MSLEKCCSAREAGNRFPPNQPISFLALTQGFAALCHRHPGAPAPRATRRTGAPRHTAPHNGEVQEPAVPHVPRDCPGPKAPTITGAPLIVFPAPRGAKQDGKMSTSN